MTMNIQPPSSKSIAALNVAPVTQSITIENSQKENLRFRFKLKYTLNGAEVNELGEFDNGKQ